MNTDFYEKHIWHGIQLHLEPLRDEYNGKKRKTIPSNEMEYLMGIDRLIYVIGSFEISPQFTGARAAKHGFFKHLCRMINVALERIYKDIAEMN